MIYVANVIGENLIGETREVGSAPLLMGDEGVVVQYGDPEGVCVVLVADDEQDAERRILATFDGDIGVIDELIPAYAQDRATATGLANLAHSQRPCADPDCEIHHPEVIEDERSRLTAMAWYEAGRRSADYEIVAFDPHNQDTYPSVCEQPEEVESRFGFSGGEPLLFDAHGAYVGEIVKQLPDPKATE